MTGKYAIITPAFNEAEFLHKVIKSISEQTVLPQQWIIVDDRSTDKTPEILNEYAKMFSFIKVIRLSGDTVRRVGSNVVVAFKKGKEKVSVDVDFIVKMDADVTMKSDYFEHMLRLFEENPKLGILSGKTYTFEDKKWKVERCPDTHAVGPCKMYRCKCYDEIGGLYETIGWDVIDNTNARMHGWQSRSYAEYPIYHWRKMGIAKGMVRARLRTGLAMYSIKSHPIFVIVKAIYRSFEKPYGSALLIMVGYIVAFFNKVKRIDNEKLAKYLKNEQLGRVMGKNKHNEMIFIKTLNEK